MKEKITFNDLLLFAFNETELNDTVKVTMAIESDDQVSETYDELLAVIHGIRGLSMTPSTAATERVLAYAGK